MRIFLVLIKAILSFNHLTNAKGLFFNKHSGCIVNNTQNPNQTHLNVESDIICLAYCQRESNCLTTNYNEQTKTCSFYDYKIETNGLVSESSSVVYTFKCTIPTNSINSTQPSIKVNSSNEISLASVYGIREIINDPSYFIITDSYNNRVLKLNENGQFIKSTTVSRPYYITKSHKYIYVNSHTQNIIKLNYDLDEASTVISDTDMQGIHYDLSNNNIYIASYSNQSIYIYHTNDEITFTKIRTISTSNILISITINNDKIYTGTNNGRVLVYNKTDYSLIQVMNNMCSSTHIRAIKSDCNSNMIYVCLEPPMVNIIGTNGMNKTLLLNDSFTHALETYIDSENRLWIGGKEGFIVYN